MAVPRILIAIDLWDDDDIIELTDEHGPAAIAVWIALLTGAKRGAGAFGARWGAIERRIGAHRGDAAPIIDSMERLGLISLERDPDGRGARVTITNWDTYQVDPTSTGRMREHRARKKAAEAPQASVETRKVSRHATSRNVTQRNGDKEQNIVDVDTSLRSASPSTPPAPRAARKDDLWDALVAELGIDQAQITNPMRGVLNRALKDLRAVNATPDQIAPKCAAYRRQMPHAQLTAPALVKHWASLGTTQDDSPNPPVDSAAIDAFLESFPVDPTGFFTKNRATG